MNQFFLQRPLATGLLLASLAALLSLGASRLDASWVGAVGLALSALGFVVGFVGFRVTLQQIDQTKTSAQAAEAAAREAKEVAAIFSTRAELAKAIANARASISHLGAKQWQSSADSMNELGLSMTRLSQLATGFSQEDSLMLKASAGEMVDACNALDGIQTDDPVLAGKLRSMLRGKVNALSELEIRFEMNQ